MLFAHTKIKNGSNLKKLEKVMQNRKLQYITNLWVRYECHHQEHDVLYKNYSNQISFACKYTYYACDSGNRHFELFWEFQFPKLADNL